MWGAPLRLSFSLVLHPPHSPSLSPFLPPSLTHCSSPCLPPPPATHLARPSLPHHHGVTPPTTVVLPAGAARRGPLRGVPCLSGHVTASQSNVSPTLTERGRPHGSRSLGPHSRRGAAATQRPASASAMQGSPRSPGPPRLTSQTDPQVLYSLSSPASTGCTPNSKLQFN